MGRKAFRTGAFQMTTKFLLDTNVWLDYFLDRSALHERAVDFVCAAVAGDAALLTALPSVKDCYFLVQLELKRMERAANGSISESAASAINAVAWSCVSSMRKLSLIVPSAENDMIEALIMRDLHQDFEDNLVAAAALHAKADYLVSSDKQLIAHQPVPCISLEDAIKCGKRG